MRFSFPRDCWADIYFFKTCMVSAFHKYISCLREPSTLWVQQFFSILHKYGAIVVKETLSSCQTHVLVSMVTTCQTISTNLLEWLKPDPEVDRKMENIGGGSDKNVAELEEHMRHLETWLQDLVPLLQWKCYMFTWKEVCVQMVYVIHVAWTNLKS